LASTGITKTHLIITFTCLGVIFRSSATPFFHYSIRPYVVSIKTNDVHTDSYQRNQKDNDGTN
ncbi:MAG: hypothetical protein ACK5OS_09060, partial [Chryseotalea sp.]